MLFVSAPYHQNNDTLEFLSLGWNPLLPKGVALLCEGLKNNSRLATVDLQTCGARAGGAAALADVIVGAQQLADVRFGGNMVGDEGAKALAAALLQCDCLARIDLAGNDVGEEGGKALLETLRNNEGKIRRWLVESHRQSCCNCRCHRTGLLCRQEV